MTITKSNFYLACSILSIMLLSCSRPIACTNNNCESSSNSQNANLNPGSSGTNDQPTAVQSQQNSGGPTPTSQGPGAADIQKILGELEGQRKLQTLVANVEAMLTTMDDQQLEGVRRGVDGLATISNSLVNQQKDWVRSLESAKLKQDKSSEQLWNIINDYAKQKEATRLNLIKELEKLELDLLDVLTPEGVSAQIQWDSFLAKLDVVREQAVKSEISKTRDEMLKAADATYTSDKTTLKSVIEGIIQTNLALVDASGPAIASRTMRRLRSIETQLQMTTDPKDNAKRASLVKQIEDTQKQLKLPLDAVDEKIFPEIVAVVTEIKTAEGYIAGIDTAIKSLNDIIQQQKDIIAKMSATFSALNVAALPLRTKSIAASANGQLIGESLTATESVLKSLSGGMNDILAGLADAAKADISKGLPAAAIKKLVDGETAIQQGLEAVAMSLANLAKVYDAKSNCSKAALVSEGSPLPLRAIQCGGDPIIVLTSP